MKAETKQTGASTLHLYGGADLLQRLKDGRIPLQTDWSFLQPYLSFDRWHGGKQQPVSEQEVLDGLKIHYEQLPSNIKGLLSFEDFLQQREKLEPQIRQQIKQQRTSTVQGYTLDRFDKAAFLRLYTSALNNDAWRYQAEDFSGLCIALRSSAAALTARKGYPALLKPVSQGKDHDVKASAHNPLPGAFMDVETSASEGEWRLVLPRSEDVDAGIKLSKGDVTRIYVATAASEELVDAVQKLVGYDLRFRQCSVFQVIPDVAHWKLTAVPLPEAR